MLWPQLLAVNQLFQLLPSVIRLGPRAIQSIVTQCIDSRLKCLGRQIFEVIEIDQAVAIIEQQVKTAIIGCIIFQFIGPVDGLLI